MIPYISATHSPVTTEDLEVPQSHSDLALSHYLRENGANALLPWRKQGELLGWVLLTRQSEFPEYLDEAAAALSLLTPEALSSDVAHPHPRVQQAEKVVAWLEVDRFGLITGRSEYGRNFTRGSRLGSSYNSLRSSVAKDCLSRALQGFTGEPSRLAADYKTSRNKVQYHVSISPCNNSVRLSIGQEKSVKSVRKQTDSCNLKELWNAASELCDSADLMPLPRLEYLGEAPESRIRGGIHTCAEFISKVWRHIVSDTSAPLVATRFRISKQSPKYISLDIDVELLKLDAAIACIPSLACPWKYLEFPDPVQDFSILLSRLGYRLKIDFCHARI
ncbi:hypothetical protein DB346_15740 [Verrucomicrobia bacterium LW23]|nr:hypothetical protein DB346_15740 [Verrucomicrobia bacterium LW23]